MISDGGSGQGAHQTTDEEASLLVFFERQAGVRVCIPRDLLMTLSCIGEQTRWQPFRRVIYLYICLTPLIRSGRGHFATPAMIALP